MRKSVGDRAKTGQRPQSAVFWSLLHHATIGTVQSVNVARSAYKMKTFLPHVENQAKPRIPVFPWEMFKYYSLWM